jgi:hypothetical protein
VYAGGELARLVGMAVETRDALRANAGARHQQATPDGDYMGPPLWQSLHFIPFHESPTSGAGC